MVGVQVLIYTLLDVEHVLHVCVLAVTLRHLETHVGGSNKCDKKRPNAYRPFIGGGAFTVIVCRNVRY